MGQMAQESMPSGYETGQDCNKLAQLQRLARIINLNDI